MNRQDFVNQHASLCDSLKEITRRKNADYTGGGSPFHNFLLTEYLSICSTEQGLLVRMSDKIARVSSLLKTGVQMVKDESVEDTLLDLANYAIITVVYLRNKKAKAALDAAQQTDTIKVLAREPDEDDQLLFSRSGD